MNTTSSIVGRITCIETYSGNIIDLLNPDPNEIRLEDIAHHLSLINRWNGATRLPFNVAQHSVLVSQVSRLNKLWALFHDAHEAFVGDDIRPKKRAMDVLGILEKWETCVVDPLDYAIQQALQLDIPTEEDHAACKAADDIVCRAEARQLMSKQSEYWDWAGVPLLCVNVDPMNPTASEAMFMDEYHRLCRLNH